MQNAPLVSVIIPTYNRLEYFKIALQSVLDQEYHNFEVIVSDDSTNDDIEKYLRSLHARNVKYYKNKSPLGIAGNIKSGLQKASGQYFAFLNDDDFWLPDFLDKVTRPVAYDPSVALVFCDHWLVDSSGERLADETMRNSVLYGRTNYVTGYIPANLHVKLFLDFTVPVAMACLMKRDVLDLGACPDKIGPAYDRWILMSYVATHKNIYYIDERLTCYRIHRQSTTAKNRSTVMSAVIFILERSLETLAYNKREKILIRKEICQNYRTLAKISLLKMRLRQSVRFLSSYLQLSMAGRQRYKQNMA